MITLFILYLHTMAAVALYTKRWQGSNWKEGLLAVGFLLLIFSVGWTMSTFLVSLVVSERGFGIWLDRDTLALLVLTMLEAVFYYAQFGRKKVRAEARSGSAIDAV